MNQLNLYESMSVQEKWNAMATVANLYYNSELTQSQIAERFYTSRSKISRMLKEARELGIVEINIKEPWERRLQLEARLKAAYGLTCVRVIAIREDGADAALQKLGRAAAYYLDWVIRERTVLGVSWGNTLYHIVRSMSKSNKKNLPLTVVPIMGAASVHTPEKDALDLSKELAAAYGGIYRYIYAPLFVRDSRIKDSLLQEANIRETLEIAKNADMILTSVGSISHKTWRDYLQESTLELLEQRGAVGHIGGHFYNKTGKEVDAGLKSRMIAISLEDFKRCPQVICVARGSEKAEAVRGALQGELINTLIIDEACGEGILAHGDLSPPAG